MGLRCLKIGMWDLNLKKKKRETKQQKGNRSQLTSGLTAQSETFVCLSVCLATSPHLTHIFLEANVSHIKSDSSAER